MTSWRTARSFVKLAGLIVVVALSALLGRVSSALRRRSTPPPPSPASRLLVLAPFQTGEQSGMAKAVKDFVAGLSERRDVRFVAVNQLPEPSMWRQRAGAMFTWPFPFQRQCRMLAVGHPALDDHVSRADVVVFEAFETALCLFLRRPPASWVILRDHEVLLRKIEIERRRTGGVERLVHNVRLLAARAICGAVYAKMDRIVTLTDEDRDAIHASFPHLARRVSTIPVPFEPPSSSGSADGTLSAYDLLMVGNFFHAPNVDALLWFLAECSPHLSPGFTLHLCGIDRPLDNIDLNGHGVRIRRHGFVHDVSSTVPHAAVAVAPVISGGGVRMKNLLLASIGRVIVTTSLGNEGIGFVHGRDALIADDGLTMARHLNWLVEAPGEVQRLAASARKVVRSRFDARAVAARFDAEVLASLAMSGAGFARE